jgi:hypothetical protein
MHPWKRKEVLDQEAQIKLEFESYREADYLPIDEQLFCSSVQHMIVSHLTAQLETICGHGQNAEGTDILYRNDNLMVVYAKLAYAQW